jgi:hypothetical protein
MDKLLGDVAAGTHVVDATMFWSATSGGVRRYLLAKHAWLTRHTGWRHTIAAPVADLPGIAPLPSLALPARAATACRCAGVHSPPRCSRCSRT